MPALRSPPANRSFARDAPTRVPAKVFRGDHLGGLERASVLEGTTLLLLMFVAVPLKHLAEFPLAVSVLGPVHGLAFSYYLWCVIETVAAGGWSAREIVRLVAVAFVPFGGFANLSWLGGRGTRGRQVA